jgi:eukaryotic-like serine/threonine-protein kinase
MSPQRLGRYEILREIATGGMAKVYLGRVVGEGGFERLVAVKVMHPHLASEPEFVAMFLDEARLAARIRHPNVVPTIDVEKGDDGVFLVMDYIEGPSLRSLHRGIKRDKRTMPVEISLRVLLDVLAGLHAAHELEGADGKPLHLVHRDVSPHNVIVSIDGVARLTDFGVARATARISSTAAGQLKGKLPYMAPEQLLGHALDRRTDIYAAGVVLWELCTAKQLFKAENEGALLHLVLAGAQTPPHHIAPSIPPSVAGVCMRALAPDPAARFPDAEEFGEALEHAAKIADLEIAKSRGVAAFVRDLAPRLAELEAAGASSVPSTTHRGTTPPPLPEPAEPTSVPSVSSAARDTATRTEAVLAGEPERSRRGKLALGLAVAGVVTAAALLYAGWTSFGGSQPAAGGEPARPPARTAAPAAAPTASASAPTPLETSTATPAPRPVEPPPRGSIALPEKTPPPQPPAPPPPPRPAGSEFRPKGL